MNKALTDSCNDLKAKVVSMRVAAEQAAAFKSDLDRVKKECEAVMQKYADLEQQVQREQADHKDTLLGLKQHEADALESLKEQMQLTHDKAMLQAEKSFHTQLQQVKADNQKEIDKYQQKYFELLQQISDND